MGPGAFPRPPPSSVFLLLLPVCASVAARAGGASASPTTWRLLGSTSGTTPPLTRASQVTSEEEEDDAPTAQSVPRVGRLPRRRVGVNLHGVGSSSRLREVPRTMSRRELDEHIARHVLGHPVRTMTDSGTEGGHSPLSWPSKRRASSSPPTTEFSGAAFTGGARENSEGGRAGSRSRRDSRGARRCAPPQPSDLRKLGWKWNAWKYYAGALGQNMHSAGADGGNESEEGEDDSVNIVYSVGVGRDITFDAALLAAHTRAEVHGFDNTPVASEFISALGAAGGVPARWFWHQLLLAPRDDNVVTLVLPRDRGDSFTPVASHASTASSTAASSASLAAEAVVNAKRAKEATVPVTLPAQSLWRIMSRLQHGRLDILKVDVEGAEFQALAAMEAYYGADGPPVCQLLLEWHERFFPGEKKPTDAVGGGGDRESGSGESSASEGSGDGGAWDVSVDADGRKLSGVEMRVAAEASLERMGFKRVECWTGDECMYWSCNHCP